MHNPITRRMRSIVDRSFANCHGGCEFEPHHCTFLCFFFRFYIFLINLFIYRNTCNSGSLDLPERPELPERPPKYRKGVISCIDFTSLICIGIFVFNYYKAIYVLCKSFYCPTIMIQSFWAELLASKLICEDFTITNMLGCIAYPSFEESG